MSIMSEIDQTIEEVAERIAEFIPQYPEIMTLDSPWGLLTLPGVDFDDIGPSLGQVTAGLERAQARARR